MTKEKIKLIMDAEYERMYPFEIEREFYSIFKLAEENKDESVKQEILWEIDLLNRTNKYLESYYKLFYKFDINELNNLN